jgi:hypothetical protein
VRLVDDARAVTMKRYCRGTVLSALPSAPALALLFRLCKLAMRDFEVA